MSGLNTALGAVIRPLRTGDIETVLLLQAAAYGGIELEQADAFLHKLEYAPAGCWVAEDADGVCAYVFSHPGRWLKPPAIGAVLTTAVQADCWYLHDLVVAEHVRGQQLALRLLGQVQRQAQSAGFARLALISLQQAVRYWVACGFTPVEPTSSLQTKLYEYGVGACYMVQRL